MPCRRYWSFEQTPSALCLSHEFSACCRVACWQRLEGAGRRGEASAHTGEILQRVTDGCKISLDLGNKISKLILSQIIAYLNASEVGLASHEVAVFVCCDGAEPGDLSAWGCGPPGRNLSTLGFNSAWIAENPMAPVGLISRP